MNEDNKIRAGYYLRALAHMKASKAFYEAALELENIGDNVTAGDMAFNAKHHENIAKYCESQGDSHENKV